MLWLHLTLWRNKQKLLNRTNNFSLGQAGPGLSQVSSPAVSCGLKSQDLRTQRSVQAGGWKLVLEANVRWSEEFRRWENKIAMQADRNIVWRLFLCGSAPIPRWGALVKGRARKKLANAPWPSMEEASRARVTNRAGRGLLTYWRYQYCIEHLLHT